MAEEHPTIEQRWDITYRHSTGETAAYFFEKLKGRQFVGKQCPKCHRVLMPPRAFCDRCHASTEKWVDVESHGTIESSTIIYHPFKGMPEVPYALAYVLLQNAGTAMFNFVRGIDLTEPREAAEKLEIGTRVNVAFIDQPEGAMTDFWYEIATKERKDPNAA